MSEKKLTSELAKLSADTIRLLAADGVQKANSGHPGMPMGMADCAFVLWNRYLKFNSKNPSWLNRDRFVLSACSDRLPVERNPGKPSPGNTAPANAFLAQAPAEHPLGRPFADGAGDPPRATCTPASS